MSLAAAIEVSDRHTDAPALQVRLRITNPEDRKVTILNPDMGVPSPALNWPESNDVYQTFLLTSFGFLSMTVTDEAGNELPLRTFPISATPALRPPVELAPGDSLELVIPVGSFYQLEAKKSYRVAIEYGDHALKVSAGTRFTVP